MTSGCRAEGLLIPLSGRMHGSKEVHLCFRMSDIEEVLCGAVCGAPDAGSVGPPDWLGQVVSMETGYQHSDRGNKTK